MDQPPKPYRAGLAADRELVNCPLVGNGANREQGEVERASEVPPSHWVDATDELLLADLGNGRWEYRDSYIEGVWVMSIGEYEFLAITDLHERQFQTFSQATTWLDGVYAGVEECADLMRKTT